MKCARRPSWPSGPIWKVRPVWDSTSTCPSSRWARSVRSPRFTPRPCVNTTGRGSWCRGARKRRFATVLSAGRRPARAGAQHLIQDEGINLNGVMRILEPRRRTGNCGMKCRNSTGVTGFSVFTADMNGSITQTSRSHRARYWRGQLHAEVHALPRGRAQARSRNRWCCGIRPSTDSNPWRPYVFHLAAFSRYAPRLCWAGRGNL